jgi:hypothetical protein
MIVNEICQDIQKYQQINLRTHFQTIEIVKLGYTIYNIYLNDIPHQKEGLQSLAVQHHTLTHTVLELYLG